VRKLDPLSRAGSTGTVVSVAPALPGKGRGLRAYVLWDDAPAMRPFPFIFRSLIRVDKVADASSHTAAAAAGITHSSPLLVADLRAPLGHVPIGVISPGTVDLRPAAPAAATAAGGSGGGGGGGGGGKGFLGDGEEGRAAAPPPRLPSSPPRAPVCTLDDLFDSTDCTAFRTAFVDEVTNKSPAAAMVVALT
jgi:hypothetical protein